MSEEKKKIKIEFAPGAFDNFDGTQEELNELVAEIGRLAESGELFERSQPLDIDDLDDDEIEELMNQLDSLENNSTTKRTLQ
jgi:hypothetical protein